MLGIKINWSKIFLEYKKDIESHRVSLELVKEEKIEVGEENVYCQCLKTCKILNRTLHILQILYISENH